MSESLKSIRLQPRPLHLTSAPARVEGMLHFYDTHFSGAAFCLLHNIWQAAPRREGAREGGVGNRAAKALFFSGGGVALSERYKGTLCASDLLLLLSVMASRQNEVS